MVDEALFTQFDLWGPDPHIPERGKGGFNSMTEEEFQRIKAQVNHPEAGPWVPSGEKEEAE